MCRTGRTDRCSRRPQCSVALRHGYFAPRSLCAGLPYDRGRRSGGGTRDFLAGTVGDWIVNAVTDIVDVAMSSVDEVSASLKAIDLRATVGGAVTPFVVVGVVDSAAGLIGPYLPNQDASTAEVLRQKSDPPQS